MPMKYGPWPFGRKEEEEDNEWEEEAQLVVGNVVPPRNE
jgi:hypothetical protein